ncbi:hypothetical protein [Streptomyces sp. NPDC058657]|uniref:hypothetical protein n=1 Tax=unclassified Streptomyces TaxID=2593676 RepID=UPI00365E322E
MPYLVAVLAVAIALTAAGGWTATHRALAAERARQRLLDLSLYRELDAHHARPVPPPDPARPPLAAVPAPRTPAGGDDA